MWPFKKKQQRGPLTGVDLVCSFCGSPDTYKGCRTCGRVGVGLIPVFTYGDKKEAV